MNIFYTMLERIKCLLNLNPAHQNLDLGFGEKKKQVPNFDCNWILGHIPSSKIPKITKNSPNFHTLKYIKYKKVFRARSLVL